MQTIGTCLERQNGLVPGFDALRLIAASLVLFSHAVPITTGSNDAEFLHRLTDGQLTGGSLAVIIFFAVSGFVISASLDRSKRLIDFVWRRALRLLPALMAVVLVSVFVIGPLFTSLSSAAYFGQFRTWQYLGNAVFLVQHDLPGVFSENTLPGGVNGSLWTLRWEVLSYAGLTVLWIAALRRSPVLAPVTAAAALLVGYGLSRLDLDGFLAVLPDGAQLFGAFMCGASLYVLRHRIPAHRGAALALLALLPLLSIAGVLKFGLAPVIAYACLTFSLASWPQLKNDYSYGVYLWAFPIQQIVVALGLGTTWIANVAWSLPFTLLTAVLSWHLLEKPVMGFKNALRAQSRPAAALAGE